MYLRAIARQSHIKKVLDEQGTLSSQEADGRKTKSGLGHRHHQHSNEKGYDYMVASIDLYSRNFLNCGMPNYTDAAWCREILEETIGEQRRWKSSMQTREAN